jgi:hypothetical protein
MFQKGVFGQKFGRKANRTDSIRVVIFKKAGMHNKKTGSLFVQEILDSGSTPE